MSRINKENMADALNREMPEGFEHPKAIIQEITPPMLDEVLA